MQKWEYLRLQIVYGRDSVDHITINGEPPPSTVQYASHAALNQYIQELGAQGWEMVSDSLDNGDEILYFKRAVE